jgi:hypothetical protein
MAKRSSGTALHALVHRIWAIARTTHASFLGIPMQHLPTFLRQAQPTDAALSVPMLISDHKLIARPHSSCPPPSYSPSFRFTIRAPSPDMFTQRILLHPTTYNILITLLWNTLRYSVWLKVTLIQTHELFLRKEHPILLLYPFTSTKSGPNLRPTSVSCHSGERPYICSHPGCGASFSGACVVTRYSRKYPLSSPPPHLFPRKMQEMQLWAHVMFRLINPPPPPASRALLFIDHRGWQHAAPS